MLTIIRRRLVALALVGCLSTAACSASTVTADPATQPATASATPSRFHATELRPGDCFDELSTDGMATLSPCEKPHVFEFAGVWVLKDGPWPGEEEVARQSTEGCEEKVHIRKDLRDTVTSTAWAPGKDGWPKYRTAYCLALAIDEGAKLTGHVLR